MTDRLKGFVVTLEQPTADPERVGSFSDRYQLAIYWAVARLHYYEDELKQPALRTLGAYREANNSIVNSVIAECLDEMNYELSNAQLGEVLRIFLAKPAPRKEEQPQT